MNAEEGKMRLTDVAKQGGNVAKVTRAELEAKTQKNYLKIRRKRSDKQDAA